MTLMLMKETGSTLKRIGKREKSSANCIKKVRKVPRSPKFLLFLHEIMLAPCGHMTAGKGWSRVKKEKLISGEWGIQHRVHPELVEGTNVELALNMLAEASTTEISRQKNPKGYRQSAQIAKEGGSVAKAARRQLESKTDTSAISSAKASDYLPPADRWESLPEEEEKDD